MLDNEIVIRNIILRWLLKRNKQKIANNCTFTFSKEKQNNNNNGMKKTARLANWIVKWNENNHHSSVDL